jgi:hypothetical protein
MMPAGGYEASALREIFFDILLPKILHHRGIDVAAVLAKLINLPYDTLLIYL